jgi:hypothetical protein
MQDETIELDTIKLLEEIDALKKENEKQKQDHAKYNTKVDSWKEKMKQISIKEATKMKELENTITKYKNQDEILMNTLKVFSSTMETTNSNIISHFDSSHTHFNQKMEHVGNSISSYKVQHEKRLKRLAEKEKETERKLARIEEQSQNPSENEVEVLNKSLLEKSELILDLTNQVNQLSIAKTNLEKQVSLDHSEIKELNTKVDTMSSTIHSLNHTISTCFSIRTEKYTILEHVVFDEVNWCLIEEGEGVFRWVSNVPKDDLPDSLQEALQEEFERELNEKQESFERELNSKLDEKDEELRKYRARAVTALRKKTEELTSEKTINEEKFIQIQEEVNVEKSKYIEVCKKNDELRNQLSHLVEFQTKYLDAMQRVEELEGTLQERDTSMEEMRIRSENEVTSLLTNHEQRITELVNLQSEMEEDFKKNSKTLMEKQKRIVGEFERENDRLKKTISELQEIATPKIKAQDKEKNEFNEFLELAQLQASRDQEMSSYQDRIKELETTLNSRENMEIQLGELQEKLTRFEFRENANLEYLKNILIKFFESNEREVQQKLLGVVSTVLAFSPEEKKRIERSEKKETQWSIGSMFRGSPQK